MKRSLHNMAEVSALQETLHRYKVPYTMTYIYSEDQEYWNFDIPNPEILMDAVIAFNVHMPPKILES